MKTTRVLLCLSIQLMLSSALLAQVVKLWETDPIFMGPESVAYDSAREVVYVSNYTGRVKEGTMYSSHFISKVRLDGTLVDLKWAGNVTTPTGICIFADKLYIVERFGVVEYDLKKDTISINTKILFTKTG